MLLGGYRGAGGTGR